MVHDGGGGGGSNGEGLKKHEHITFYDEENAPVTMNRSGMQ